MNPNHSLAYKRDIFNDIRQIPLISVMERYSPNQIIKKHDRGWLLCPFHVDKHPSLSFKGQRWRCWSCGAAGDGTDFVARLYGLRPIDAARLIASDFGIETEFSEPLTDEQRKEIQKRQDIRKMKKAWNQGVNVVFRMAADLRDLLLDGVAPEDIDGETLEMVVLLENLMDVLMTGDFENIMAVLNGGDSYVTVNGKTS